MDLVSIGSLRRSLIHLTDGYRVLPGLVLGSSFWSGSHANSSRARHCRSVRRLLSADYELTGAESDIGNLSVAFNTGLTVGAFTWGLLVDILGVSPAIGLLSRSELRHASVNGVSTSLACSPLSLVSCLQVSTLPDLIDVIVCGN